MKKLKLYCSQYNIKDEEIKNNLSFSYGFLSRHGLLEYTDR